MSIVSQLVRTCSHSFKRQIALNIQKSFTVVRRSANTTTYYKNMNQKQTEFVLELKTPFEQLDCQEAFDNLTATESKYLHYYTKVSFFADSLLTKIK